MDKLQRHLSATTIATRIRHGELTPSQVIESYLNRIDKYDDEVNAFRVVFDHRARKRAAELEKYQNSGEIVGPLHGVPIAVKDNVDVANSSTLAGKKPLSDRIVDKDEVVIKRLKKAGAIIIGKTHMPELGYATTDTSWGDPTSTPFDLERNSGGSSGGSAAAVGADFAAAALGTDGGGSIRIPASCCGVYGIKPSFRRIPRTSITSNNAFTSLRPFSEYGPITRTVEDAAVILNVMAGESPKDIFTRQSSESAILSSVREFDTDIDAAYSPDLGVFPISGSIRDISNQAVDDLRNVGLQIEEVDISLSHSAEKLSEVWMSWIDVSRAVSAEIIANQGINLIEEHREELHPEYIKCIKRGQKQDLVEYLLSDTVRTDICRTFHSLFKQFDVLLSPVLSIPPVENSYNSYTTGPSEVNGESVDPHIGWCLTYPFNFSGHPAASVPAGFTKDGLPVGLQIIGPRFADEKVLHASSIAEQAFQWDYDNIEI